VTTEWLRRVRREDQKTNARKEARAKEMSRGSTPPGWLWVMLPMRTSPPGMNVSTRHNSDTPSVTDARNQNSPADSGGGKSITRASPSRVIWMRPEA
jgi:hypothetical protein